jgi:hypothetical protein
MNKIAIAFFILTAISLFGFKYLLDIKVAEVDKKCLDNVVFICGQLCGNPNE